MIQLYIADEMWFAGSVIKNAVIGSCLESHLSTNIVSMNTLRMLHNEVSRIWTTSDVVNYNATTKRLITLIMLRPIIAYTDNLIQYRNTME